MDERTDEELEIVFDLGSCKVHLTRYKSGNPLQRDDIKEIYFAFKTLASKLDIDLPDQPPETTTEDKVIFYRNQVTRVENHLKQHKDIYSEKIFSMGYDVEELLNCLSTCNDEVFGKNESLSNQNVERLPKLADKIKIRAKSLGIDTSEELSKVNDHEKLDKDDLDSLQLNLKTKLCKLRVKKPTQKVMNTRRSEVDRTRIITDEYWAISLVRLPDSSNSQHAFLVLEGKSGNESMIWFADFVAEGTLHTFSPGIKDGIVRTYYDSQEMVDPSRELLFQCNKTLMEVRNGERWLHQTWHISEGTAQNFIKCIGQWKKKPPKYNILGNSRLAAGSAIASSTTTGHNCFTFARMMLLDLKDECIEIPEGTLEEWVCSITSRYLVDKQFNNKWWQMSRFPLMFTFLAGAVIAYSFVRLRYARNISPVPNILHQRLRDNPGTLARDLL